MVTDVANPALIRSAAEESCADIPCNKAYRIILPLPPVPLTRTLLSSVRDGVGVGTGTPNSEATSESASNSLKTLSKEGKTPVGGIEYSISSNCKANYLNIQYIFNSWHKTSSKSNNDSANKLSVEPRSEPNNDCSEGALSSFILYNFQIIRANILCTYRALKLLSKIERSSHRDENKYKNLLEEKKNKLNSNK
ncbi:hypothetical protein GQX74_004239 [Glossina fuscipes]|nr:hypothetical protein GQX74_004239 [Glossina fuscipes]